MKKTIQEWINDKNYFAIALEDKDKKVTEEEFLETFKNSLENKFYLK